VKRALTFSPWLAICGFMESHQSGNFGRDEIMQQGGKTSLFVILIAASAATAGLIFGYDVAVLNGALVFLRTGFRLSPLETGMIPTMLLAGCAIGAAVSGSASDRYGRRRRGQHFAGTCGSYWRRGCWRGWVRDRPR
jgi:hypothetical protein